jgi:signal transduction histidine kinase
VDQEYTEFSAEQFQANRFDVVSRLADDLAHEIKNPLNAIIINLEVLKVRIARGDPGAAADRAQVIEQEVRRLHELVDRMLMLIRPEREEGSDLPVDSALSEILPLVEAQARLARNEFTAVCTATVLIRARRDVFKFALLNLIMAVHARLGEGGGRLAISCAATEDAITFTVTAESLDGALPVAGEEAGIHRAAAVAEALLHAADARITPEDCRVTLVMPRVASI